MDQEASAPIRPHAKSLRNDNSLGAQIRAQGLCVGGGKSNGVQTVSQSWRRGRDQLYILRVIRIKADTCLCRIRRDLIPPKQLPVELFRLRDVVSKERDMRNAGYGRSQ